MIRRITMIVWIVAGTGLLVSQVSQARNPIRNAFFNYYTSAENTRLDNLPSNSGHCGVCHYDFDGGGTRNFYGAQVEVLINNGFSNAEAIAYLDTIDADNDGYTTGVEVTSLLFDNTPTFPGLNASNYNLVSNVTVSEITDYLTPAGTTDTIPPVVTVTGPVGGESWDALSIHPVTWTATDANGIAGIKVYLSPDGGATFKTVAINEPNDGSFSWLVPNRPGSSSIIRVEARDAVGNMAYDDSPSFTINAQPGIAPTTLADMDLPGTQPLSGVVLDDPDLNCRTCHADYDPAVEPWYNWKGSMMGQAMRDPLFLACLAVAEQDAPSVGDLCLRCHTPGGWAEGHSVDTGGGQVTAKDRQSVQCDFCHRAVDPDYKPGISPIEDVAVLDSLTALPYTTANGQFVIDSDPIKRGPFADAAASHAFLESPFHVSSDMCKTCHDVSNPVFNKDAPGVYSPNAFNTPHPTGDLRDMFPIERTASEYAASAYPNGGVYQPQFAGNKGDGIVSTCQDCHMADVVGKGCNEPGAPTRSDLPFHDLTGGNTFIPDILPTFFPAEVDPARLAAGKARATAMLQLAASLALGVEQNGAIPVLKVTVTNETAHKLPSGYPEGRRIWLNVKAYDALDQLVFESGAYNGATGELDETGAKVYHIEPGISHRLSPVVGMPAGPSFHFVFNDTVYYDNRIPPRGFTNAAFVDAQSPPVGYSYPDSQYWDETSYDLPSNAAKAVVKLYYQTTSKEYIEFLRDANTTNSMGLDLYNAWVAQGKNFPVTMAEDSTTIELDPTPVRSRSLARTELYENVPNPFNPSTTIRYSLAERQRVRIDVFDVRGARVTTLVDDVRPAGLQQITWWGINARGDRVASGVYLIRMTTAEGAFTRKAVMVK
jgi:hypothetical protein